VLHNPELAFFADYLAEMGCALPPKPEERKPMPKEEPKPAAAPEKEEEMEVESEESDVDLDMEGVLQSPDAEELHEMVCWVATSSPFCICVFVFLYFPRETLIRKR
jgi:hypothetical protein